MGDNKLLLATGGAYQFAKLAIVLAVFLTILHFFVVSLAFVGGQSMVPTLESGQIIVIQKAGYGLDSPARGDVVVVNFPGDPEQTRYVKRIIGLPGETVETTDTGTVLINGRRLPEGYAAPMPVKLKSQKFQTVLQAGQYWLMGDNRPVSSDSRNYGSVDRRFIVGKAVYVLWPLSAGQTFVAPLY